MLEVIAILAFADIRSAKPLEQYLAERISSKKIVIDQLNQMSVEEGYQKVLLPFTKLPAPFKRIAETHQKLGWLDEDGIASEYGLLDINDSGFISENEIDKTFCKELQAVVRRDNQLWYDADIVKHFDNAGKVIIQLHEEIYAWGKRQDEINWEIPGQPAHETSTKTRRLILKILDDNIDQALVNENLKALGFSTMYWENLFKVPTSVGYYMDTNTCVSEQQFLKNFFKGGGYGTDFWLKVENLFSNRYLKSNQAWPTTQLQHNFPDALSNMISLMLNGKACTFGRVQARLTPDTHRRLVLFGCCAFLTSYGFKKHFSPAGTPQLAGGGKIESGWRVLLAFSQEAPLGPITIHDSSRRGLAGIDDKRK